MKVCKHCHCREKDHPHPLAGKICAKYEEKDVAAPAKPFINRYKLKAFQELVKKSKRPK